MSAAAAAAGGACGYSWTVPAPAPVEPLQRMPTPMFSAAGGGGGGQVDECDQSTENVLTDLFMSYVRDGLCDEVRELVDEHTDALREAVPGAFTEAVSNGDVDMCRAFVELVPTMLKEFDGLEQAACVAIMQGDHEMLTQLFKQGADVFQHGDELVTCAGDYQKETNDQKCLELVFEKRLEAKKRQTRRRARHA